MFMPFTNYGQFLSLAQAFEDGCESLQGAGSQSDEQRRRADGCPADPLGGSTPRGKVRRLKACQSWHLRTERDRNVAAVYAGEDNVMQGGVDLTMIVRDPMISREDIAESFDEPLTRAEVTAIASMFIVA